MFSQFAQQTVRTRSRSLHPSTRTKRTKHQIMTFNLKTHVSTKIEKVVGLRKANIDVPRRGDRTAEGDLAVDQMCAYSFMHGLNQAEALIVWNNLTDEIKTGPGNAATAIVLSKIASVAEVVVPQAVTTLVPDDTPDAEGVLYIITPGSPVILGKRDANKFISFLYLNMDNRPHRVKWSELTGEEQYEWYTVWLNHGKSHLRIPETVGLRGTNLDNITTIDALETAMGLTPSLKRRRTNTHALTEAEWTATKQRLEFE